MLLFSSTLSHKHTITHSDTREGSGVTAVCFSMLTTVWFAGESDDKSLVQMNPSHNSSVTISVKLGIVLSVTQFGGNKQAVLNGLCKIIFLQSFIVNEGHLTSNKNSPNEMKCGHCFG